MDLNSNITNNLMNSVIKGRISGSDGATECTAVTARQKVEQWQGDGQYVVANAGAYDALGLNHLRGLIQSRVIGAAYKLGSTEDLGAIYDFASSDQIRLIVSLDTNRAIRDNKSFRNETGNSIRPLYDWGTRASMLALQSIRSSHDLVDFITKHGPGACNICGDDSCWHSDKTYSVASTGADLTIVKSLNQTTKDQYGDSAFHVVNEGEGAFFDQVLNSQISTSALVRRVKMDRSH